MFLLYGKRSLIIKKYTDHSHACPHCRGLNLKVEIKKSYYHLFYIPFFPARGKFAAITCGDCGKPYKESVMEEDYYDELEDAYEKRTKNPIYLYAGLILIVLIALFMIFSNLRTQQQKAEYIANPHNGDTYLIRDKSDGKKKYFFLQVNHFSEDSVFIQKGKVEYPRFIVHMSQGDYFLPEVRGLSREALKKMLNDGKITSVKREK